MDFITRVYIDLNPDTPLGLGDIQHVDDKSIRWEFSIDAREWGIKGFNVYVPEQTLILTGTHIVNDVEEDFEHLIMLGNVTPEFEFSERGALSPDTLYLEYNEKTAKWDGQLF